MAIDPILNEADGKMGKSIDALQRELNSIRTGRANPALIEKVQVNYYGVPTPLNQLAQISTPEARLLMVNVYDRNAVSAVEKALRAPEVGFNPSTDGNVVRVPIPPLTEERRKEYVRMVRQKAEDARVAVRNIRRDELHQIDKLAHDGEVAEDEARRAHERLQKVTDARVEQVDQLAARKEAEVMEV